MPSGWFFVQSNRFDVAGRELPRPFGRSFLHHPPTPPRRSYRMSAKREFRSFRPYLVTYIVITLYRGSLSSPSFRRGTSRSNKLKVDRWTVPAYFCVHSSILKPILDHSIKCREQGDRRPQFLRYEQNIALGMAKHACPLILLAS